MQRRDVSVRHDNVLPLAYDCSRSPVLGHAGSKKRSLTFNCNFEFEVCLCLPNQLCQLKSPKAPASIVEERPKEARSLSSSRIGGPFNVEPNFKRHFEVRKHRLFCDICVIKVGQSQGRCDSQAWVELTIELRRLYLSIVYDEISRIQRHRFRPVPIVRVWWLLTHSARTLEYGGTDSAAQVEEGCWSKTSWILLCAVRTINPIPAVEADTISWMDGWKDGAFDSFFSTHCLFCQ